MRHNLALHRYQERLTKHACFSETRLVDLYESERGEADMGARREVTIEAVGQELILLCTVTKAVLLDALSYRKLAVLPWVVKGAAYYDGNFYLLLKTDANLIQWIRMRDSAAGHENVVLLLQLVPAQFQRIMLIQNQLVSTSGTRHYWHVATRDGTRLVLQVERTEFRAVFVGSGGIVFQKVGEVDTEFHIFKKTVTNEQAIQQHVVTLSRHRVFEFLFCEVLGDHLALREPGGSLRFYNMLTGSTVRLDCQGELKKTLNKNARLSVLFVRRYDFLAVQLHQIIYFYDLRDARLCSTFRQNFRNFLHLIQSERGIRILGILQNNFQQDVVQMTPQGALFGQSLPFDQAYSTFAQLDSGLLVVGRFDGQVQITGVLVLL